MQNWPSASCACEECPKTKGGASRQDVPELRHDGVIEAPRRGGRAPGRQGRQSPCACRWRLKPERREWPDLPRSQGTGVESGVRWPVKELKMGGELGGRKPVSDRQRKSAAKVNPVIKGIGARSQLYLEERYPSADPPALTRDSPIFEFGATATPSESVPPLAFQRCRLARAIQSEDIPAR